MSAYVAEGLIVLPGIRLNRLHQAVERITGDRDMAQAVMDAVEQYVEQDAYRWGNACPIDECGERLGWQSNHFICPEHGWQKEPTELLIAFKPQVSS